MRTTDVFSVTYYLSISSWPHVMCVTCPQSEGTRREVAAGAARGSKGETALRAAAANFLQAGALRRYCEIMARLGEWHLALSVAPGVSLRYWRQLNLR